MGDRQLQRLEIRRILAIFVDRLRALVLVDRLEALGLLDRDPTGETEQLVSIGVAWQHGREAIAETLDDLDSVAEWYASDEQLEAAIEWVESACKHWLGVHGDVGYLSALRRPRKHWSGVFDGGRGAG